MMPENMAVASLGPRLGPVQRQPAQIAADAHIPLLVVFDAEAIPAAYSELDTRTHAS